MALMGNKSRGKIFRTVGMLGRLLARLGLILGALVALLVIFHRPLLFGALGMFVSSLEKDRHLDIYYEVGGSLFSSLRVSHLSVRPTVPGNIQKIDVGEFLVTYSLGNLLRSGLSEFLQELSLSDVDVEMTPGVTSPSSPGALAFPVPGMLQLRHVSVVLHESQGDLRIDDLNLGLHADRPGALSIRSLSIPGLSPLEQISARTSFVHRRLVFKELFVSPELPASRCEIDLSQAHAGMLKAGVEGTLSGSASFFSGSIHAQAEMALANGVLDAEGSLDSGFLASADARATGVQINCRMQKRFAREPARPVFDGLAISCETKIADLTVGDFIARNIAVSISGQDDRVSLAELTFGDQSNRLTLRGNYRLPPDLRSWTAQPLSLNFTARVSRMESFVSSGSSLAVRGALLADGSAELASGRWNGWLTLSGSDLAINGVPFQTIQAQAHAVNDEVDVPSLVVECDGSNGIWGSGHFSLGDARSYAATARLSFHDLALLQPLLGDSKLAGKIACDWDGRGEWKTNSHTGGAWFDIAQASWGNLKNFGGRFHLSYAEDFIDIPDLALEKETLRAAASLFWKDNRLQVDSLGIRDGADVLIEGSASLPLDLFAGGDKRFPVNEPLGVKLRTSKLQIEKVSRQLGLGRSSWEGQVFCEADFHGSWASLLGRLSLQATGLCPISGKQKPPKADASLDVSLAQGRLNLNGRVGQEFTQPLVITGNLPFDVPALARRASLDLQTPVECSVVMPRSSLSFLSSLVPGIRECRGTAGANLRISGTLARPIWQGRAEIGMDWLRFRDPRLPPVNNLDLDLACAGKRLTVRRGAATIAGGTVSLSGDLDFSKHATPLLALRFGSRNALLLQNDDLSVRVSSDLSLRGPWETATLQGSVWITRSRFFRSIDILPIGLPGRPAPQPPPEPDPIGVFIAPFRDWTLDIAVRTLDPFLIQNNLATGRISADMRIGGKGREPWMDGTVHVERLVASLPFSRLHFEDSRIFFTRQAPFVPQLNLQGTSTIRDYHVTVHLTGPATAPEALFLSEPPLSQADVISLLATGMTKSEFERDPQALGGRATILAFQKLTRHIFRRSGRPPANESFLNRIQFDLGGIDPKTGRQSTALGIPLSERFMLTGGVDVGGNFRGQVRYLIRFP